MTPSSSVTQLVGVWLLDLDLDLEAKVAPSARARGDDSAQQPTSRSVTSPTTTGATSCPNGGTAQSNSPRFLLR